MNPIGFLSVVIPFFNEEENAGDVILELAGVLKQVEYPFEIVAVDDGSTDGTWARLASLKNLVHELRLIKLRVNCGQTRALSIGLDAAKGDWILTMDGDGQNDPKSLPVLFEKVGEGYDVISGWRKNRKDSKWLRTIPSRAANWLLTQITGLSLHDSGCSLKLYRAKALRSISLYSDRHRFIPFLLHMRGFRVAEAAVSHRPRLRGISKYGFSRTIKVLLDLIVLTLLARFKESPRFYFFIASAPFVACSFLFLVLLVSRSQGWAGIANSVISFGSIFLLFYTAVSLASFGLLTEWINHFERTARYDFGNV